MANNCVLMYKSRLLKPLSTSFFHLLSPACSFNAFHVIIHTSHNRFLSQIYVRIIMLMFNSIFVILRLTIEVKLCLLCSEKYASKWFIGLSFIRQQQGMQIDLTFEIRNFCDLGMYALDVFTWWDDRWAVWNSCLTAVQYKNNSCIAAVCMSAVKMW